MSVIAISHGVKVEVENFYQQDFSNPLQQEFMFAYRITITNKNDFPIKLQKRHWDVFDSCGQNGCKTKAFSFKDGNSVARFSIEDYRYREIEGDGVVGMQPVIAKGDEYVYVSGCNIRSELGSMCGFYTMQNLKTEDFFDVRIPSFEMIVPFKNN